MGLVRRIQPLFRGLDDGASIRPTSAKVYGGPPGCAAGKQIRSPEAGEEGPPDRVGYFIPEIFEK